jgi:transposase
MLTLAPVICIHFAARAPDLRRSTDGPAGVVRKRFGLDRLLGHLFVVRNRRHDGLKLLVWDKSGGWILCRRLHQDAFAWRSEASATPSTITGRELNGALSGVDLAHARVRRPYDRKSVA